MAMNIPEWLELSKQRAVENGYEPFEDSEAYGGEVFVKEDRKWIHSIGLLKHKLGVLTEGELESLGYSVTDYYRYNSDEKGLSRDIIMNMVNAELLEIFGDCAPDANGSIDLGEGIYIDEGGNILGDWNR
jgi:hypothetical protein